MVRMYACVLNLLSLRFISTSGAMPHLSRKDHILEDTKTYPF